MLNRGNLVSGTILGDLTDALGNHTSFAYDLNGNLITMTDPSLQVTTFAYNAAGQPIRITDPLGNITRFDYDVHGNLLTTTDPLGNQTQRTYDTISRLIAATDPQGHTTQWAYNPLNQVTHMTDAVNGLTRFTYDPNGNLLTVTDAKGQTTSYTYDGMDQLATRTDPLARVERYSYDQNGNLTGFTDRKGQISSYSYDPLDRRVWTQFADGSQTTSRYDVAGRLAAIDEPSGTIALDYDTVDRLIHELTPQGTVQYTYDALGRRTTMTANGQASVSYQYDAVSRLTQVAQGTQAVGLAYDAAGRRTGLTYPNGTRTSYGYDAASRLTSLLHQGPAATAVIEALTYTYDAAGNRIGFTRANQVATALPSAVQAAYDAANEQIRLNSATPNLTYDANGNLTSQTGANGTTTYTWDGRNRLVAISGPGMSASFVYDALGRRVSKTINRVRTDYQYDRQDIVAELDGGAIGASYLRSVSIDEPFIRQSVGNEYYHLDALGNTLRLTDITGAATTAYTYEAFGKATTTGASSNPFQYTGRENDGTTEMYYYRARYYSPTMQRFISEDPLVCGSGVFPLRSILKNPQTINAFAYVNNSPLSLRDPLGLSPECQYYEQRCSEVRSATAIYIYCTAAKTMCEIAPRDTYTNCVRNCLQSFDQNICATGTGRKDPSSIGCYLLGAHATCFPLCLGAVTVEPPR